MPGIMFRLRWNTIQSEPASVITTRMMVKTVESSSHPLGLGGHVQEIDHVDEDLHQGADQHDRGGIARARDDAGHHQEERDRGQDHRQDEAGDVGLARPVRGVVAVAVAVIVVGSVQFPGAHRSTPSR